MGFKTLIAVCVLNRYGYVVLDSDHCLRGTTNKSLPKHCSLEMPEQHPLTRVSIFGPWKHSDCWSTGADRLLPVMDGLVFAPGDL